MNKEKTDIVFSKKCASDYDDQREKLSAMLDICRQRAEKNGIASRCTFHEGYLESLSDASGFYIATSILVSHFIVKQDNRRQYFSEIASKLKPDGYLIEA